MPARSLHVANLRDHRQPRRPSGLFRDAVSRAMTEVLKIEGLSAGYGPLRVIHDLDLVIHPGERVAFVGLNGHGKTTLFLRYCRPDRLATWIHPSQRQADWKNPQPGPGRYTTRSFAKAWPSCRREMRSSTANRRGTSRLRRLPHRRPGGPVKSARNAYWTFSSRCGSS